MASKNQAGSIAQAPENGDKEYHEVVIKSYAKNPAKFAQGDSAPDLAIAIDLWIVREFRQWVEKMKEKGFTKVLAIRSVTALSYWEDKGSALYELDTTYPSDVSKSKTEQVTIILEAKAACGGHPEPDTLYFQLSIKGDKSDEGVYNNFGMVIQVPGNPPRFKILPSAYHQCDEAATLRNLLEGVEIGIASVQKK
jgi:hypothetical protein